MIKAEGRAFSAGGDILDVYQGERGNPASQFFADEYRLNAQIARYTKPYVALIDGIVMGGGVGVSFHGSHRVLTENAKFAMPEVGIGFFPDVGGSHCCPTSAAVSACIWPHRQPHRLWRCAVVGARHPYDEGRSTRPACSSGWPKPATPIGAARIVAQARRETDAADAGRDRQAFRAAVAEGYRAQPGSAADDRRICRQDAGHHAHAFADQPRRRLPRHHRRADAVDGRVHAAWSSASSTACSQGHDFYEGIRAVIIDKGDTPQWRPADAGGGRRTAASTRYFAPLGEQELVL